MSIELSELKKAAAHKAVEQIKSGMIIGLGTGSTSVFAIRRIGELITEGVLKNIKGIPSSKQSEKEAEMCGVPLTTFDEVQKIDITIDGADEVDAQLNLIKGGGGALLREKVLAQATSKQIIVIDETKLSKVLGTKWHVPIEVIQFAAEVEKKFLESLGAVVKLRTEGEVKKFITDEGNFILDANFGEIKNPKSLAAKLEARAGIVEHGLFLDLADEVIVASESVIKSYIK